MKSFYFVGFLGALLSLHMACGSNGPAPRGDQGGDDDASAPGSGGSGVSTGTFGAGGTFGTGTGAPPCLPSATQDCGTTAAPGCGDGVINQASEQCDDGNSVPGDGCSGVCKTERYYTCPTAGKACVTTIICGDGMLGPGEACDDGNKTDGDGCAASCRAIEKGYRCATAGKPCERVHSCGDGAVDANEGCDDGNNVDGDGCSKRCRFENGFKCTGNPSVCTATVCGDGVKEGAESCDDSNKIPFDGCSATCQTEPKCGASADVRRPAATAWCWVQANNATTVTCATATAAPTRARSNRDSPARPRHACSRPMANAP